MAVPHHPFPEGTSLIIQLLVDRSRDSAPPPCGWLSYIGDPVHPSVVLVEVAALQQAVGLVMGVLRTFPGDGDITETSCAVLWLLALHGKPWGLQGRGVQPSLSQTVPVLLSQAVPPHPHRLCQGVTAGVTGDTVPEEHPTGPGPDATGDERVPRAGLPGEGVR